jgi:CBS domain-containing protein
VGFTRLPRACDFPFKEESNLSLKVKDVMTPAPIALEDSATVFEAARAMRDGDFGSIIVLKDGAVFGVVTDRDVVVRAVAEGRDMQAMTLTEICSGDVTTVAPGDSVDDAADLMQKKAIRRVPVVDKGRLVGVVSLGDLAKEKDEGAALAGISAAPPNR